MLITELKKGLIVSCQATSEEPMRDSAIMGRFALAAQIGGAIGVRVNGVADIMAARQMTNIPTIGLIKRKYPDFWCYITPTLREVAAVYATGAEIVAIDACQLPKPGGISTEKLIKDIKKEFKDILILADVSTCQEGIQAVDAGADLVSTTLSGYTEYTRVSDDDRIIELQAPDIDLVAELVSKIRVPVIAEGRFWDDNFANKAFAAGAHNVVIGAGITRPQIITKKIVDNLKV